MWRRLPLRTAGIASAIVLMTMALAAPASAQGRCMTTYGAPSCNTADIPPVFAPTGWKTVAMDQVTFELADYKEEAAFYIALMGWTLRSDDGQQAVLDLGDWGSAIFRKAAPGVLEAASASGGRGGPFRAAVTGFGFAIDLDRKLQAIGQHSVEREHRINAVGIFGIDQLL